MMDHLLDRVAGWVREQRASESAVVFESSISSLGYGASSSDLWFEVTDVIVFNRALTADEAKHLYKGSYAVCK